MKRCVAFRTSPDSNTVASRITRVQKRTDLPRAHWDFHSAQRAGQTDAKESRSTPPRTSQMGACALALVRVCHREQSGCGSSTMMGVEQGIL